MVFGFVAVFIGIALGLAAGIWAGTKIFEKKFGYADLSRFDIRADYNDNVPVPDSPDDEPVPKSFRQFLDYFPNWATHPDFYRVSWINHVIRKLWPVYNQAVGKMALDMAKPYLTDIPKQYPFVSALDIELIDFGTKPATVGGIKVYLSSDDEVIMETPLLWGSNASIRASARIRVSKWSFYMPIEVSNIQMKLTSRITIRPLVDTLPCVGALTMSVVETPYIDFALHLFEKFDIMLLPGVSHLANYFIQMVLGDMIQYPNKMTFDIMENGGVPPPPVGLLQVKIVKVENITEGGDLLSKVDPYVTLAIRSRSQRTKTVWNSKNPDYDEVFNLIVDDPNTQVLTMELHDDDMGFNDPMIGIIEQDLADSNFMKNPRVEKRVVLDFIHPPSMQKMKRLVKKQAEDGKGDSDKPKEKLEVTGTDEQGRKQYKIPDAPAALEASGGKEKRKKAVTAKLHCELTYVPFTDSDTAGSADHKDGAMSTFTAKKKLEGSFSQITDDDKGILTVTVTGAKNLEASDGGVDPYIVLTLEDPTNVMSEVQKSSHMTNEPNPHWNMKFDFALIAATSVLRLHIYDKKTTFQNALAHPVKMITGMVTGKPTSADEPIGSLKIKVTDVVRNERLRDTWALQETQKGDVMLTLDWHPIEIDNIEGLEQAGDQREVKKLRKKQADERDREQANGGDKHDKHKHHIPFVHHHHHKEDEGVERSTGSKIGHGLNKLNPFTNSDKVEKVKFEKHGEATTPRGEVEKSSKSSISGMIPDFMKSDRVHSVAYE